MLHFCALGLSIEPRSSCFKQLRSSKKNKENKLKYLLHDLVVLFSTRYEPMELNYTFFFSSNALVFTFIKIRCLEILLVKAHLPLHSLLLLNIFTTNKSLNFSFKKLGSRIYYRNI